MSNNYAENYNSVLTKFVGGKRVCFFKRGSYEMRYNAAGVSFNRMGTYQEMIHRHLTKKTPGKHTKKFVSAKIKSLRYNAKRKLEFQNIKNKCATDKSKNDIEGPDKDYGPEANFTEDSECLNKKTEFVNNLNKSVEEIAQLEKLTVDQSSSQMWKSERSKRITASRFGKICKLKKTTNRNKVVHDMLFSTFIGNRCTRYGIEKEPIAIEEFREKYDKCIDPCGLFVDEVDPYLGASLDGVIRNENAIIEVKCPYVSKDLTPDQAIALKKIKCATYHNGTFQLKRNHDYFYQMQGQLHVAKQDFCYFILWSPKGMLVEKVYSNTVVNY
jgi:hypothetical protein